MSITDGGLLPKGMVCCEHDEPEKIVESHGNVKLPPFLMTGINKAEIREAIKCLKDVRRMISANANTYEVYGCTGPGMKEASERRKRIDSSIQYLEEICR